MVPQFISQIILIVFSALGGAWALLWLQSKYQRIRFLRALEDELNENLHEIQEIASAIQSVKEPTLFEHAKFSDEVYRTIRVNDPLLSVKLFQWMDPLYHAYTDMAHVNQVPGEDWLDAVNDDEVLEILLELENNIVEAGAQLRETQRSNLLYRIYNFIAFREDLSSDITRMGHIVLDGKNWREEVDENFNYKSDEE